MGFESFDATMCLLSCDFPDCSERTESYQPSDEAFASKGAHGKAAQPGWASVALGEAEDAPRLAFCPAHKDQRAIVQLILLVQGRLSPVATLIGPG